MEAQMTRTPSPDEVMAAKGENGYWPREKLQEWGIPLDPTPARWREHLERRWHEENIPDIVRSLLVAAGHDDEGVETAWRSVHFGLSRMRMYEEYWLRPEKVIRWLRAQLSEIILTHPDGGEITLRLPVDAEIAGRTLKALGKIGWTG
jgi:hypothetical protein